jgi:hypothetical protein
MGGAWHHKNNFDGLYEREHSRYMQKTNLLRYIDHLQKKNADDLAFYPISSLEKGLDDGNIHFCYDNDEPAGYFWHGPIRAGHDIVGYQISVDYSSRRRHLGWGMVAELLGMGKVGGALGIRLRCASSSEANDFWRLIGFYCTNVKAGGVKRSRDINYWRTDIQQTLFTLPPVTPSVKPIDLSSYQKNKREGMVMPSRWSRAHY